MGSILSKKIKSNDIPPKKINIEKKVLNISNCQHYSSGSLTPYKSTVNSP